MVTANFNVNNNNGYIYYTSFDFVDNSVGDNIVKKVWNFGDGGYVYNVNEVSHTYQYPGIYTVGLQVYDSSNNIYTYSLPVTATSYVQDYVNFTQIPKVYSLAGLPPDVPFNITVQSSQIVDTLNVQLYAANSKSIPQSQVDPKWSFLTPTWRFCLNSDGSNIIDSLVLSASPIYLNNVQVGVSAAGSFYFIDDIGSGILTENAPLLLAATLSTVGFVDKLDAPYYSYMSFSNSKVARAATTWQVNDMFPNFMKITGNYIDDIYPSKWTDVKIPAMITLHGYGRQYIFTGDTSYSSGIVFEYPQSNDQGLTTQITLSLSSATGIMSISADDYPLYFITTDNQGFRSGGYKFTSITTASAMTEVALYATTTVYNSITADDNSFQYPLQYAPNQFVYIPAPDVGCISKIIYTPQLIGSTNAVVEYYRDNGILIEGSVDRYYVPVSQNTDTTNYALSGFSGIYGLAVDPRDFSVLATDGEQDKLFKISTDGVILSTLDFSALLGNSHPEVSGVTPSYVSMDKNFNFWVSLYNSLSVLKFDTNFNLLFAITPLEISINEGDYLSKPPVVETDRNGDAWVTYCNPLSSNVFKYSSTGILLSTLPISISAVPVNIVIDKQNNVWVTEEFNTTYSYGLIEKYDGTTGKLLSSVSGFDRPAYIALDRNNNVWFTCGIRSFGYIDRVTGNTSAWSFSRLPSDTTDQSPRFITLSSTYTEADNNGQLDEELGGIAVDVYNRVWVIDSVTNNAHVFNADPAFDYTIAKIINVKRRPNVDYFIDNTNTFITSTSSNYIKSAAATGDWTGNVWYQKYAQDALSAVNVSGISVPFNIYDYTDAYSVRKINDSFNMAGYMKSLAFPEILSDNAELFDVFLPAVVGDGSELLNTFDDIGRESYEKIANFTSNISDLDTCDIDALKSIAAELGQPALNYGVNFPNEIQRMLDLASISRQRLWGEPLSGTDTLINNMIDWNSVYTTLDKTLSSDWYVDDGIIETIFNYILTKNLLG